MPQPLYHRGENSRFLFDDRSFGGNRRYLEVVAKRKIMSHAGN
jgi:hypothetical protein